MITSSRPKQSWILFSPHCQTHFRTSHFDIQHTKLHGSRNLQTKVKRFIKATKGTKNVLEVKAARIPVPSVKNVNGDHWPHIFAASPCKITKMIAVSKKRMRVVKRMKNLQLMWNQKTVIKICFYEHAAPFNMGVAHSTTITRKSSAV